MQENPGSRLNLWSTQCHQPFLWKKHYWETVILKFTSCLSDHSFLSDSMVCIFWLPNKHRCSFSFIFFSLSPCPFSPSLLLPGKEVVFLPLQLKWSPIHCFLFILDNEQKLFWLLLEILEWNSTVTPHPPPWQFAQHLSNLCPPFLSVTGLTHPSMSSARLATSLPSSNPEGWHVIASSPNLA